MQSQQQSLIMEFRKEQMGEELVASGLSPDRQAKEEVLKISLSGCQNSRTEKNLEQKLQRREENAFGQSKLNT